MFLPSFPSSSKNRPSLASLLEKTIDEVGWVEWARITHLLRQAPFSDPHLIPSRNELLSRAKTDWNNLIYSFRTFLERSRPLQLSQLLPQGLGLSFSFWLPHIDIALKPKGDGSRELFFHRPVVVYLKVILQWWQAILSRVTKHPELTPQEKRGLELLLNSLNAFEKGLSAGTYRKDLIIKTLQTFSVIKKRGTLRIKVDPSFFRWLEEHLFKS